MAVFRCILLGTLYGERSELGEISTLEDRHRSRLSENAIVPIRVKMSNISPDSSKDQTPTNGTLPKAPLNQIIALVEKYSAAIRLAVDSPSSAPQILAELETALGTHMDSPGIFYQLSEFDGERIRTTLSGALEKPNICSLPYRLANLDALVTGTPEILDSLCCLPNVAAVLGRAIIEPLLYHSYSHNSRLEYRAAGASVISTHLSDASQAHICSLCAYSVLCGFDNSIQSPSVKEYLAELKIDSVRVPVTGALQERVSHTLLCSLKQGIFIPEDYWSLADDKSRKEIVDTLLSVEKLGRKERWDLITSWFESQCAPCRHDLRSQRAKIMPYSAHDKSTLESLKELFLDSCSSINQSLKMINLFAECPQGEITRKGRFELERSLAETCAELLKFYMEYPKPLAIPRELVLGGMNESLEHFTLYFDEAVPDFNEKIALSAFRHALFGFKSPDVNSAILIRQLLPPDNDHLHTSRRFIIDDWIDQSQPMLRECLTQFAENICARIGQRSGSWPNRFQIEIDKELDTFKRGITLLVDMNVLKNSEIDGIKMLAPLVYRLINSEQKSSSIQESSTSEISPHFYGCVKAVELLQLMPDTISRRIVHLLGQKRPELSEMIASFIIYTNQDFSRDLVLLHGRDIQSSEALLSYNRALAAEKLYRLWSTFGKELPVPVTHELRRSFTRFELGLRLAKTHDDISLPPEALPNVTLSELKLLSYWVDDLLQSEVAESRSGHLRRFHSDVCANRIKIDSSLAWLLVIASDDYLQTEIPILKRESAPYDIKAFEQVAIGAFLPLTFNLAQTPQAALSSFFISLSNLLALPQSANLFGAATASQASKEILHYLQERLVFSGKELSLKELTSRPAIRSILRDIGYSDSD